jgi:hypothetical protein
LSTSSMCIMPTLQMSLSDRGGEYKVANFCQGKIDILCARHVKVCVLEQPQHAVLDIITDVYRSVLHRIHRLPGRGWTHSLLVCT